ncbi:MAG: transketolase [Acidobacteriia bacterium]|nr:transketolase [Terriglobia bacterium]MYK11724.1 transketolase [Terriglobia bacterium]
MSIALATNTLDGLKDKATRMRIHSVRATTEAGSGHPTTCASAAEIMTALFFDAMRFDPRDPASEENDVFILSKGHAAPVLYAAWSEVGYIAEDELLNLRRIDSDLEGHPPTTLPFVDVATGSLGQGLSVGVGMAHACRLDRSDRRIWVLLGDGEVAEGSVWEAASMAANDGLGNLIATVDVNRLGQSAPTMLQHDMEAYRARWEAFGWETLVVDGHDIRALIEAYAKARESVGQPTVILAKTYKGRGIPCAEDKDGWHGKPIPKGELADETLESLQAQLTGARLDWTPNLPPPSNGRRAEPARVEPPPYQVGGPVVATRQAYGAALEALARADSRVVGVDGDVGNSTFTTDIGKVDPGRLLQCYIAEQNLVGVAMGLACRGKIPFASSFACFLARGYDFMRLAAISSTNIKLVGTHAGVSIGEDGASQMGLEDLAMACAEPNYTVFYPSDATSAWRAIELAAGIDGPVYVRTSRPKTGILYGPDEAFEAGGSKVLRASASDSVAIVGAGVTLYEALKAADELASEGIRARVIDLFSVQPIDRETLAQAALECGGKIITVEDHYAHGGVGSAVLAALAEQDARVRQLAVRGIARSGKPDELLDRFGISARHIVAAARDMLA